MVDVVWHLIIKNNIKAKEIQSDAARKRRLYDETCRTKKARPHKSAEEIPAICLCSERTR